MYANIWVSASESKVIRNIKMKWNILKQITIWTVSFGFEHSHDGAIF